MTNMLRAPRERRDWAVVRDISPAPMTMTCEFLRWPKIFSARSTATLPTEVWPSWIPVELRTFFPTEKARWNRRLRTPPVTPASRAAA